MLCDTDEFRIVIRGLTANATSKLDPKELAAINYVNKENPLFKQNLHRG